MRFEWDARKAAANLEKHGVAFDEVARFEWRTAFTRPDDRAEYGEQRWVSVGLIGDRLHKVAYTWRAGVVRIISLHKANARDRRKFDERS
ncbi:MAG: BrnT family toxin [Rubrimonas sp.]|uniref:BrnT family toxin n=1 Tax=Rubrimonas sp. TaxID=2036015 RepID=UPI002FDE461E